jgi:hypothetical protein
MEMQRHRGRLTAAGGAWGADADIAFPIAYPTRPGAALAAGDQAAATEARVTVELFVPAACAGLGAAFPA